MSYDFEEERQMIDERARQDYMYSSDNSDPPFDYLSKDIKDYYYSNARCELENEDAFERLWSDEDDDFNEYKYEDEDEDE